MKTCVVLLTTLPVLIVTLRAGQPTNHCSEANMANRADPVEAFWNARGDAVVGVANQVKVTKQDLLRQLWFQYAPAALEDLLKEKAIQAAAEAAGIHIGEKELASEIQRDVSRTKSKSLEDLLTKQHITRQHYEDILLTNLRLTEYARKQLKVLPADYDKWVKVRYIFIADGKYESDPARRKVIISASRDRAEKILKRADAGADFAELANQYSDSPENVVAGKKQGGALGWISTSQMEFNARFKEACFKLEAGAVSPPVRADFGWYLVKADALGKETRGADQELNGLILEGKVRPAIDSMLEQILTSANLTNKLVPLWKEANHVQ